MHLHLQMHDRTCQLLSKWISLHIVCSLLWWIHIKICARVDIFDTQLLLSTTGCNMCAIILKEKTIAQKIGIHLFRFVHKSVVKILFRLLSHFLLSDLVYFYYISSISYLYNLVSHVCVCMRVWERRFSCYFFSILRSQAIHMEQSMRQHKCMRHIWMLSVLLAFLLLRLNSLAQK